MMQTTTEEIQEKTQQVSQVIEKNQNVGNAERVISGLAAAVLGYYGIKKKDTMLGKGLTAVSGFLLTRATTGFCPLNNAIGRNSLLS